MPPERPPSDSLFRIVLLATGGTIEKSYDAHAGHLTLDRPVIDTLVGRLVQPDINLRVERVMAIDSLEMGAAERQRLGDALDDALAADASHAVLITHGTDTLAETARALAERFPSLDRPVVLTGAMVPFRAADSDALQNVAQAIMACRLLLPGVYAVFHGRVIEAAKIAKDYQRLTLVERAD
ncbi:MAG: asparaginase domain-containing protein [Salinisphaera sp.]|jgi:L-asparaginase|nr:asparaginase domain-containing protein [Salinisphaera sp.]